MQIFSRFSLFLPVKDNLSSSGVKCTAAVAAIPELAPVIHKNNFAGEHGMNRIDVQT